MIDPQKILLTFFLILSMKGYSQEKILVGFQLGPNIGYPKGSGESSGIYNGVEGVWGINMTLINKHGILLETGRFKTAINYSTNIQDPDHLLFSNTVRAVQIPLRLQKRINIRKNKIFISPSIGFSYLYKIRATSSEEGNITYAVNSNTVYYSQTSWLLNRNGFLLETGAKVEFVVLKHFILNIASYYSYGLRSLAQSTISWNQPASGMSGEEKVVTKGNNLQFFLGFSYIIYDKQRKSDSRIHKKEI
jgi:hypothetical protein